jgi:maleate isomerase
VNTKRIGLVVPSSNTTMETEIPQLLRRREEIAPKRFTTHASRVQLRQVTPEELARMNRGPEGAAQLTSR